MNVALLGQWRDRPSFRFRALQYLPYLEAAGHAATIIEFSPHLWGRLRQYSQLAKFDSVFIQQRLLHPFELIWLKRNAKHLIFDVDDAIMRKSDGSPDSRRMSRFRAMCRSADLVICGNQFLADETRVHTSKLEIIPTTIELNRYPALSSRYGTLVNRKDSLLTIGWTGSRATCRYLNEVFPVIADFPGQVQVKLIADDLSNCDLKLLKDVPYEFIRWSPETEIAAATMFDLGIMPLPDQEFTRGKCGCKALQYMALGIPAICSPVGMNVDLIEPGKTGFLARTANEWRVAFQQLIASPELRAQVGSAGYRVVSEQFAASTWAPAWLNAVFPMAQSSAPA